MNKIDADHYPPNVLAVVKVLVENEIPYELRAFDAPARQASQAAGLVDCPLGAIVKSLVFEKTATGELMLVLVSGQNRADEHKLSTLVGEPVQPAKPEKVLAETGFVVGAVPPCGLDGIVETIIDADLMPYQNIWASAGAINTLMRIQPVDLYKLTGGRIEDIKQR